MALPNENRTAKVVAVEQAIGKMSPQELAALPALDASDFRVFGTLIAAVYQSCPSRRCWKALNSSGWYLLM